MTENCRNTRNQTEDRLVFEWRRVVEGKTVEEVSCEQYSTKTLCDIE
jgi:hypothetical protein